MTANIKNYAKAAAALEALEGQVKTEAKADPRLARGAKRVSRLLALLKVAQGKYELVHSRKVPAKLAARKAAPKKAKAKAGGAKKAKAAKPSNVVPLKQATVAAARAKAAVKRSK